ncbi:MAG: type I restriction endonuclease subunit R [Caldilineaceae bacterium]
MILLGRLQQALRRLNPTLPANALDDALRKLTRLDQPSLLLNNHAIHRLLVDGVTVEYQRADGTIAGAQVQVIDYERIAQNDWLVVNQFTVVERSQRQSHERRPDIVVFVNGLPLAVFELKNAADEKADIWQAFKQLQTYKEQIPSLFAYNAALVISDGTSARIGTLSADRERFTPWRTIDGSALANSNLAQLQVTIEGVFEKRRFLDLLRYFLVFEEVAGADKGGDKSASQLVKKMAAYHQYHAVNVALDETLRASFKPNPDRRHAESGVPYFSGKLRDGKPGDQRVGVIWHTQGSGKSLTMAFYAGRVIQHAQMQNPTLVVLTDRNDLDDQLFGTFARCRELLRQPPVQANSRADLRQLLAVDSGGVIFTTIQKFLPDSPSNASGGGASAFSYQQASRRPLSSRSNVEESSKSNRPPAGRQKDQAEQDLEADLPEELRAGTTLSDRANIVVIADEAHRSQYDFIDGYAAHMRYALPNASFIGFTGTPIELSDKNTRAVFGDYISIYDIQQAVSDGATVPIYYEGRLAKLALDERERPHLDPSFEEATEGEEVERKEKLKSKWAQLEALVGAEKRVNLIAADIVNHYEQRLSAMEGKAMIVCMSRRICIDLYKALVALRPEWHSDDDQQGLLKIIMTGSAADDLEWQPHIRNKARREKLGERFRNAAHPFKIVIVRDMWLTGFDAPSLHTMYVDKPMRGHGLMQAIARVNRVFKDKPGGLIVDYLGLADELRSALQTYTESGGQGNNTLDQNEAVAVMLEKYEICTGLFHGFNWSLWLSGTPAQKLGLLPAAQEHILAQANGKARLVQAVSDLSKAFALAVPHDEALRIRDTVAFFQAVRSVLAKNTIESNGKSSDDLDHAVRQLVSRAVSSDQVIDIFAAAGLKKPDISVLDERFLAEVRALPQRNLAVELLQKLLNNEIKTRSQKNVVQSRSFAEMLDAAVRRYQNRGIETAQVIEEMIAMAAEMRAANERGVKLGLSEDELAFYDALEVNDSAVKVLGDDTLKHIAQELVTSVKRSVTIDWTVRETVRAQIRVLVKRILRKYGYPPDKQEKATQTVLEQAEVIAKEWAVS